MYAIRSYYAATLLTKVFGERVADMAAYRDKAGRPIVVVTGRGVLPSLGTGKADNWAKMMAGESGIHTITRFAVDGLKTRIAGTVDFVPVDPVTTPGLSERFAEIVAEEA